MLSEVTVLDCAFRVAVALLLGALIGFERQWRQRMAGLRTNALVATGSCLFVLMTPLAGARENPLQIAAYVVSGIGFLAGGVIFKERLSVSGLNTAATLWCTAAIGSLVGLGFVAVAAIGVGAIMVANVLLRPVVHQINRQPQHGEPDVVTLHVIRTLCRQDVEERIRALTIAATRGAAMTLVGISRDGIDGTSQVAVTAEVEWPGRADARLEKIVSRLGAEAGVISVRWTRAGVSDDAPEALKEAAALPARDDASVRRLAVRPGPVRVARVSGVRRSRLRSPSLSAR